MSKIIINSRDYDAIFQILNTINNKNRVLITEKIYSIIKPYFLIAFNQKFTKFVFENRLENFQKNLIKFLFKLNTNDSKISLLDIEYLDNISNFNLTANKSIENIENITSLNAKTIQQIITIDLIYVFLFNFAANINNLKQIDENRQYLLTIIKILQEKQAKVNKNDKNLYNFEYKKDFIIKNFDWIKEYFEIELPVNDIDMEDYNFFEKIFKMTAYLDEMEQSGIIFNQFIIDKQTIQLCSADEIDLNSSSPSSSTSFVPQFQYRLSKKA